MNKPELKNSMLLSLWAQIIFLFPRTWKKPKRIPWKDNRLQWFLRSCNNIEDDKLVPIFINIEYNFEIT